jgi:hypothetical protein
VAERARRRHVDGEVLKRCMLDAAPNQTVVVGVQLLGTTWISRYENVRPLRQARWTGGAGEQEALICMK